MLQVKQNLGSLEAAETFNKKRTDWVIRCQKAGVHPGCVKERACIHCFYIIEDPVCMCVSYNNFVCPNCGKEDRLKWSSLPIPPLNTIQGIITLDLSRDSADQDYVI